MIRHKLKVQLLILGMITVFAAEAFASGGGGDHAFPWLHLGVSFFNFAIFIGLILKFGGPGITSHFATRREDLMANLNESKRLREEAEKKFEEYTTRLDNLEQERKELLDEYHEQGEREKEKLVDEAKAQVEKMRSDAELIIQQEMRKAVSAIETQAVDLAISLAEKQLKARVDDRMQNGIVDSYLKDLNAMESSAA